ncbi:MAG: hypothetical protein IJC52_00425, partial [Clostridia bacterium]|nr:hypothetical protein [Clostridia bacterium]
MIWFNKTLRSALGCVLTVALCMTSLVVGVSPLTASAAEYDARADVNADGTNNMFDCLTFYGAVAAGQGGVPDGIGDYNYDGAINMFDALV